MHHSSSLHYGLCRGNNIHYSLRHRNNIHWNRRHNEGKAPELRQQLAIKDKEAAALRTTLKEIEGGAGSRKTAEGGIKKTGQQSSPQNFHHL